MANINLNFESKRGCGYRKEGGFYLVLEGGKPSGCGMLPIPIPDHIKNQRVPKWIECKFIARKWEVVDVEEEIKDVDGKLKPILEYGDKRECDKDKLKRQLDIIDLLKEKKLGRPRKTNLEYIEEGKGCKCFLKSIKEEHPGLLIWVGVEHYGVVKMFMREADRVGISRRIPKNWVKKMMRFKEERGILPPCFLAHRESGSRVKEDGEVEKIREIFTAFIPNEMEYIVKEDDSEEYLNGLEELGLRLIKVVRKGEQMGLGFEDDSDLMRR